MSIHSIVYEDKPTEYFFDIIDQFPLIIDMFQQKQFTTEIRRL